MKIRNTKNKMTLSQYCNTYVERFNARELSRSWQRKAAYVAATATLATGMFLGSSSDVAAQNTFNCAPEFVAAGAEPELNPNGLAAVADYSMTYLVDYDGDGDFDLLVGQKDGGEISYFENIGSTATPQWAAPVVNPNGLGTGNADYAIPAFVDIDGDGDQDAFVGDKNGDLNFYQNTGSATAPAYAAAIANPFGFNPFADAYLSPSFGDIDGDGDFDLLMGNDTGNLRFYTNTGTSTAPNFPARLSNPFGLADVGGFTHPEFVDIDADGDLDVLVGEFAGDFNYFENTGSSTAPAYAAAVLNPFDIIPVDDFGGGYSSSNPTFGDLNGDGDFDMFSGTETGDMIYYPNGGTAQIADYFVIPYNLPTVGNSASYEFADVDGDGDLDAFIGDKNGDISFTRNEGTATEPFYSNTIQVNPFGLVAGAGYASPELADIDGDGDFDLMIGDKNGDFIYHQNVGNTVTPNFAAAQTNPFGLAVTAGYTTPELIDVNGDGLIDVFAGTSAGDIVYYTNTGSATTPIFSNLQTNPFGFTNTAGFITPSLADIDRDNDLDLFVGTGNEILFYANNGTLGTSEFAAPLVNPFGLQALDGYYTPNIVDIDNDGVFEAIVGQKNGEYQAYENNMLFPTISITGTGTFNDCNVEQMQATIGNYLPENVTVSWYNALGNVLISNGLEFNPEALQFRGNYYATVSTANGCTDKSATLSYEPVVPPVGTTLSAQAGYNTAILDWAREGECDSPILEYEVYADPGQYGTYFLTGFSSTTNFEAVGLINGEKINFRVRPIFVNGTYGTYSNIATVKPSIILGEEDNEKVGFAFFPNPNNGEFNLRLQDGSTSATVSVTSLSGQRVYTTTLNATQTSINLGNVASGMYIVRVETTQGTYQQKVSVVR